jgi:hypothetical protein
MWSNPISWYAIGFLIPIELGYKRVVVAMSRYIFRHFSHISLRRRNLPCLSLDVALKIWNLD